MRSEDEPSDRSGLPFIPAVLDDYGLTQSQFRVLCHISRRGICEASLPSMARVCHMEIKTLSRALQAICAMGIIRREFRAGLVLKLSVAPLSEWNPRTGGANYPTPIGTLGGQMGSDLPQSAPSDLPQSAPYKGYPSKVLLLRKGTRFAAPSLEEVKLQASKIGLPDSEAEKFWNYYESNGWRVGKNPMRSWSSALTNWKLNQKHYDKNRPTASKPNPRNFGIPIDTAEQGRQIAAHVANQNKPHHEKPLQ